VLRSDAMPPFALRPHHGELWLAEQTTGKFVNVGNRNLVALGLWTVDVRGLTHHLSEVKQSDLSPRSRVTLIREPDNEFDRNAIAVHSTNGIIGYVNKQMASRMAKVLDSGGRLSALTLAGEPSGTFTGGRVRILAASPETIDWLETQ
jgi:hypothetical protein